MKAPDKFLLTGVLLIGLAAPAFASDWDVAGKVLTGIEGVRIVTGGKVDPVGAMIGLMQGQQPNQQSRYAYARKEHSRRVWVPHYVWKKEYIPEHQEHSDRYGTFLVVGHFIRYRVENGGHWATRNARDDGDYRIEGNAGRDFKR